jgi:SAM-dependent methyltransferase
MRKLINRNSQCRICKSKNLDKIFSLGPTPLANSFLKKGDFSKERSFPLDVYLCHSCFLVQLLDVVDKKHMFSHYVYFYSAMPQAPQHFVQYSKDIVRRFIKYPRRELVLEIGSNDGLLLKAFKSNGCSKILGVDPAKNVTKIAVKNGVPTITDFFNLSLAKKIIKRYSKAKVVVANNTVAHINDLHDLVKGIKLLLEDNGVFVFEVPYLMDMFKELAFDSIYHEHLSYFSILPLLSLFKQYDMDIFDVQLVKRQGNSIRVFVCHSKEYPVSKELKKLTSIEIRTGFAKASAYHALSKKISLSKIKLNKVLIDFKKKKYRIAAYGSPARGNTILNYCKIGPKTLDYVTEELPSKIGLYTPGMHIPVIDVREARKKLPDYFLLLAWNYKNAFLEKEKKFINQGGKFIIPVNGVKII